MMDNKKINQAIEFAMVKHAGQIRKVTKIPYITHIFEVMQTLKSNNADEATIIAGILHDTLEDTHTTAEEIEALFGKEVLNIVLESSEQKDLPYAARKAEHIGRLYQSSVKAKLVFCADMLANASSLLADYKVLGDEIWKNFNGKREEIRTYFKNAVEMLSIFSNYDGKNVKMYDDLLEIYNSLFGFVSKLTEKQVVEIIRNCDPVAWFGMQGTSDLELRYNRKKDTLWVGFSAIDDNYESYKISNFEIKKSNQDGSFASNKDRNLTFCQLMYQLFKEDYKKEFEKSFDELSLPKNSMQTLESEENIGQFDSVNY